MLIVAESLNLRYDIQPNRTQNSLQTMTTEIGLRQKTILPNVILMSATMLNVMAPLRR
jgi:hypothetical protein